MACTACLVCLFSTVIGCSQEKEKMPKMPWRVWHLQRANNKTLAIYILQISRFQPVGQGLISSICLRATFSRERHKSCLFLKMYFTVLFCTKISYKNCAGQLQFVHGLGKKIFEAFLCTINCNFRMANSKIFIQKVDKIDDKKTKKFLQA